MLEDGGGWLELLEDFSVSWESVICYELSVDGLRPSVWLLSLETYFSASFSLCYEVESDIAPSLFDSQK